jgi:hypothetical protein
MEAQALWTDVGCGAVIAAAAAAVTDEEGLRAANEQELRCTHWCSGVLRQCNIPYFFRGMFECILTVHVMAGTQCWQILAVEHFYQLEHHTAALNMCVYVFVLGRCCQTSLAVPQTYV